MASRAKRVSILAFSNLLIFSVQFFSPVVLVRILSVETYGQYREFIVFSSLIAVFIDFYIKDNIIYFVAKNPEKEKEYISNTIIIKFLFVLIGMFIIYVGQDYFLEITSENFIVPLLFYLFFVQNFDFLTLYWLAKKKSDYVFYYSFAYAFLRLIVVVAVSYYSGDIEVIINSLVIFEFVRFLVGFIYIVAAKLFVFKLDKELLKEQLTYIIPLGISTVIIQFNSEVSKIIISANLGVTALAFYSVGSQKLPFIPIIRNSVSNVVFPDVVEKMGSSTMEALDLWKRSVTLYIFFMAPIFVVFFYYAELVVVTLYTKEYIDATPIFQIYLILIIYHCFDMGIPIRGMNKNKLLLMGHIASLFVNIGLLYVLFNLLGMIGPPIAYVTTEILLTIFFGAKVLSIYKIKFKEIFYWDEIFKLLAISIVPIVILFGGNYLPINDIVRAIVFSSVYLAAYYYLVRKLNIEYLNTFITRIQTNLLSKLKVKF